MANMDASTALIEPSGILDGTKGEAFRTQVEAALQSGAKVLLIDLKEITFVDSSGLGALVSVLKRVRARDCEMVICSMNDQVRMLFELTSMDQVFEIFPNREAFESRVSR